MGSYGPAPENVTVPEGYELVGYRCTNPGHDCLVPVSEMRDAGDGLALGPNHHASWEPVFARKVDE